MIRSLIDDRLYIGSAFCFRKRFTSHRERIEKNLHRNARLQNFVLKYGSDSLEFSIVEVCEKEVLLIREQHYLDTLRPAFNICLVAGNTAGRKFSEKTKERMSLAKKGRSTIRTEEGKKAVIESLKNRIWSDESREKIRLSKSRPIAQYDLNGRFIQIHSSSKSAAESLGLSRGDVHACCRGWKVKKHPTRITQIGGFQWKFFTGNSENIPPWIRPKIPGRPPGKKTK